MRLAIHEFLRYESVSDGLQDMAPFGSIGARMRGSQKYDAVCGDINGVFVVRALEIEVIRKCKCLMAC